MDRKQKTTSKTAAFFLSFVPAIVIIAVQFVTVMIGAMFLFAGTFAFGSYSSLQDLFQKVVRGVQNTDFLMGVSSVYAVVCILFFTWISKMMKQPEDRSSFGFRGISPLVIPGALLFALAAQYLSNYLIAIDSVIYPRGISEYEQLMENSGMSGSSLGVLAILYAVILGPICEELAFREVTLSYASRALPFWGANLLQALLFGLIHMNFIQFTYAFCLGLVLGFLRQKTESVTVTMLVHICFNGISAFLSDYLPFGKGPYLFCLVLFLAMAGAYGGILLIEYSAEKRTNGRSMRSRRETA